MDERPPALPATVFRQLLESLSEGVDLVSEDGLVLYSNPAHERMFGYDPGELAGRHVSELRAEPRAIAEGKVQAIMEALRRDGQWRGEWRCRRKDGSEFFTSARITAVEVEGRRHFLCVQEDVTEQRRTEQALRESQGRLELATHASGIGVWDWDVATGDMVYSPRAKAIYGFAADATVNYELVAAATHPDDYPFTSKQAQRSLDPRLREHQPYEYRVVHPGGEVRWVRAHGEAVFETIDGETRAVRYVGTLEDITEEKAAAERLRLLTAEVDHRANNLMSVVQATIQLTRADDIETYRDLLLGRVGALANAHRLLAKSRWTGAEVAALVEEEMRPYRVGDPERVKIAGPRLSLMAPAAQSLSMALHELGTNAAKYGAFANGGAVDVAWRRAEDGSLALSWRERGAAAPKLLRRGFGLKMIEQSIAGQLGGALDFRGEEDGLTCDIALPSRWLANEASA